MGYTIDAFNMKEERRAGNFDKAGFYVETRGKEVRSRRRARHHAAMTAGLRVTSSNARHGRAHAASPLHGLAVVLLGDVVRDAPLFESFGIDQAAKADWHEQVHDGWLDEYDERQVCGRGKWRAARSAGNNRLLVTSVVRALRHSLLAGQQHP